MSEIVAFFGVIAVKAWEVKFLVLPFRVSLVRYTVYGEFVLGVSSLC